MASEADACPAALRTSTTLPSKPPPWMVWTLRTAAIYNVVWGTLVVLLPSQPFAWLGMEQPNYPALWQCVGMVVGVYGVGYWIAACNPARHWPIVLVGWLGKVLGPIGFLSAAMKGQLPWVFGVVNITNDLIWWVPFSVILMYAWRTNSAPRVTASLSLDDALHGVRSQLGRTIAELSATQSPDELQGPDHRSGSIASQPSNAAAPPPLVGAWRPAGLVLLFIRHAGCTFCREALADLASARKELESQRLKLAVVHMSSIDTASALLARYGLEDIDHFSDPDCRLFQALGLSRGSLWQVLGPAVWLRGLQALLRHGIGSVDGDGFQLGGAFLLRNGKVVAEERLATSAQRAQLAALVRAA